MSEKQITHAPHGHILANCAVWSPDSRWIVYDVRSDPAGNVFDGTLIEKVSVETGEVRVLYESRNGACCGIPTYHPTENKIVFTVGPEHPTPDWRYSASHRQALIFDEDTGRISQLDARDLMPPFTPGALRGGTHLHTFSPDGRLIAFTYEDAILEGPISAGAGRESSQRNIGVSIIGCPVHVPGSHPRNRDGAAFSVLVTRTTDRPRPGSDDIVRACEEAWVGTNGYVRTDGTSQRYSLAFQGTVIAQDDRLVPEVFVVDLPHDFMQPGTGPLQGDIAAQPCPPRGAVQRRLSHTCRRKHPGIQGPRHWLRSSPDGSRIAFMMRDEVGITQLWTLSPMGGEPQQVTFGEDGIASAFSWHPRGMQIAHVFDGSVAVTEIASGSTRRLTPAGHRAALRPEACVFSPDGERIAFVRTIAKGESAWNQICVVNLSD